MSYSNQYHSPKQRWESSTYPMDQPYPSGPHSSGPYPSQSSGPYLHQPRRQQYPPSADPFDAYGNPIRRERSYSQPQKPIYTDTHTRSSTSAFNPRSWSRKMRVIVISIVVAIILIIVIIVGAVEGYLRNRYPDYSPLNYKQVASFEPGTFFSNFEYFNAVDPAAGNWSAAVYDSPADVASRNLTSMSSQSAILRVDNTPAGGNPSYGRHTTRVNSKQQWNDGLFFFDLKHTPHGCGTWPAVWLADAYNWPTNGEIDVIEQVNQATTGVETTLHTTNGCKMSNIKRKQTGSVLNTNCYNGTDDNVGCGVQGKPATFGPAFNQAGGGVYATELRSAGIRSWFFPRASLPTDVAAAVSLNPAVASTAKPDPSQWPEALADFPSTECDIGSHFRNQSIIINIDLCGQWAGKPKQYFGIDKCPGPSCREFVGSNPSAFDDAFFEFGAFSVFQAS